MTPDRPLLVLGIGNLLLGDEGVGIHAIRRLQSMEPPPAVHAVDGGTGGFHLLSYLRDYDRVVMIDATLDGSPPGTVKLREPRFASDFPRALTAHDIGLRDLVEAAMLLGPLPRISLVTVSVAPDQAMGTELSPVVQQALGRVIEEVLRLVGGAKAHEART